MSQGIIKVTLNRDGAGTPWGFRLHGGKDIGYPLVIQRVFLGSPSEGDLQRGDVILQVQDRDALNLTHIEAHDLIKSAGSQLRLQVHRLPGAPQSPGAYTPTSPGVGSGGHPLASLPRSTPTPPKAPMFQPMSPHRAMMPQPVQQPRKDYCYSPLPTTPILDNQPGPGGFFSPTPRNRADVEVRECRQERSREKAAIVHQGYRTTPLIAPQPKSRHDVPMGSYLRHVHDPNWRGRAEVTVPKPVFTNFFPTPTYSKVQAAPRGPVHGPSNFERPIDDNSQLVHHQYNSPMLLYSQRNVDATIKQQTGLQTQNLKPSLSVNTPTPAGQSGPLSPGGTNLAPAKAGTKLTNIVDITLSPTFQMIQEEEKRCGSPKPEVRPPPGFSRSPVPPSRPPGFGDQMNTFGSCKELIHQSGSFKSLMSHLSMTGQHQQEQQ